MIVTAQGRYFTAGIDLKASAGQRPRAAAAKSTRPGWQYRKAYRDHHLRYDARSEEHTSEHQPLMRNSDAVIFFNIKNRTGLELVPTEYRIITTHAYSN